MGVKIVNFDRNIFIQLITLLFYGALLANLVFSFNYRKKMSDTL